MVKPEKRWQLLLVADDGRIIPFKRIKGIVVTLAVLMVLLGLVCAGLGWQLTAEKVRHRQTRDRLADASRQLDHYKSEVELITTELVLAQVRMEKAGLPVTRRHERAAQQIPLEQTEAESESDANPEESEPQASPAAESETVGAVSQDDSSGAVSQAIPEDDARTADTEKPAAEKPAVVTLDDLVVEHDTEKKVLMARFRVKNNAPQSGKVSGKCVVVLQNQNLDARSWMPLPKVALVDGVPDGKNGRAFSISRFVDLEIMAPVEADPSVFDVARVYVFEPSGSAILQKDFPIQLPAPLAPVEPEPQVAAASTAPPSPEPADADEAEKPTVALSDLAMTFDAAAKVLLAQFKVSNSGSRSEPVAGRCVVVLKDGQDDPKTWLAMPQVRLVNGEPEGTRGQAFQISRFRSMEIKARGVDDPSVFKTAVVYVFDTSGNKLLEESFSIDLPAPAVEEKSAPVQQVTPAVSDIREAPADSSSTPASAQEPPVVKEAPDVMDQAQPEPNPAAGERTDTPPAETAGPSEDPSLTEGVGPKSREDTRSRF